MDRDEHGRVVHGEVHASDGVIWMHPEEEAPGLASRRSVGPPRRTWRSWWTTWTLTTAHAAAEGATIVYEPVDQSYGYRVYGARDLEGRLWSFMNPRP